MTKNLDIVLSLKYLIRKIVFVLIEKFLFLVGSIVYFQII